MDEATARQNPADPGSGLHSLLQRHFDDWLAFSPEGATELGLDDGDARGRLDDRSAAEMARFLDLQRRSVRRLERFAQTSPLDARDRLTVDSVLYNLRLGLQAADAFPFGALGGGAPFYLTQFSGVQPYVISHLDGAYLSVQDFLTNKHPLHHAGDAEDLIARVDGIGAAITQELDRAHAAMRDFGVTPPLCILRAALAQVQTMRALPADEIGLIGRLRAAGLPQTAVDRAAAAWQTKVRPALDAQLDLLTAQAAIAPAKPGLCRLTDGGDYYTLALQLNTSMQTGAEDVHRLGLARVADLSAQADTALRAIGWTQGTVADRLAGLARDPQNAFPDDADGKAQILQAFRDLHKAAIARLPQAFGILPSPDLTILPVPPALEPFAPRGYYQRAALDGGRPAAYFANLRTTADWSRFYLPTFAFHEGAPGHHLQYDIELRHAAANPLSRILQFQGYSEGWAVYAECLMDELGFYDADPVGRIGFLQSMLLRAARLVVDTGLHHYGWSRERAVDYVVNTVGETAGRSGAEVDRYIVWPGQATSYMMGQIEWLRLRRHFAGDGHGRAFHDRVLPLGAMPFEVLDGVMGGVLTTG